MIENLLLGISGSVILLLCLIIVLSNPRKSDNQTLGLFLFSGFCWLITNLLTNISSDPKISLLFARSTGAGAILLPFTFLLFAISYSQRSKISFKTVLKAGILPAVLIALTPTSLNVEKIGANGKDAVIGVLYVALVPMLIGYFVWGFYYLLQFYKRANSVQKTQLGYIFTGLVLTVVPAVITNGILPILGHGRAAFYGPNVVVIISLFTSVAIVKHRLLDIRAAVARSLAYILLLSTIIGFFGFFVFYLARVVIPTDNQFLAQQVVPLLTSIILAALFQPMKKFFDRLTNSLFFQDAYDPQNFLDELNRAIVNNVDLEELLTESGEVVSRNLKSSYTTFLIRSTAYDDERLIGTMEKDIKAEDRQALHDLLRHSRVNSISTDEIVDKTESAGLYDILSRNNIAIVARLVTTFEYDVEGVGYLLIGEKKSGNPYGRQDVKIVNIIANELVIAIQNALRFEEIEKFNITLQQKIDDATKELKKTNQKLKSMDETKDEFISMASHQLRTPLTSVKGYLSMVLEGDAGEISKMQRKLLDQAFISSQRMVYLIADLLNVSRLRTGKFIIDAQPTNLATVIESEVQQLVETAAARDLELTYEKPDNFPALLLDETKVRQVIMNFIDNAIYYTPSGGHIKIQIKDTGQSVEFTVTDDGLGVPKADQHHLFTKFYRAGNAKKARPDGTGLGLFMAKKVIVAQGGALIFSSEEGKGSTFGFSFSKEKLKPTEIIPAEES